MTLELSEIPLNKQNINSVPKEPGIYIFRSNDGTPIYIGKSINLKNRLSSYLTINLEPKTSQMISLAVKFSVLRVQTELEALLLEAKLVNIYKPQYNIQLKDDKHPLYIRITKEDFPRILTARRIDTLEDNIAIFGPFPSSSNVKSVLNIVRKIIPFADHIPGKRVCIYKQIGLCNPCPSEIVTEKNELLRKLLKRKYRSNILLIKKMLNGDVDKVRFDLRREMEKLSKQNQFEEAAVIRDRLAKLDYIMQPISRPFEFIENPNLLVDKRSREISVLQNLISKFMPVHKLKRIECYDVAHLSGVNPTASMVTFINGEAEKSLYRHFRINQAKGQDDISSLKEVAARRLTHLGNFPKGKNNWGIPDLIVVDGGKGQVGVFMDVFREKNIPIVGLAKRFETLIIPRGVAEGGFIELRVPKGPALMILQRIRNEAHRFARSYHHKLVQKKFLELSVEN